MLATFLKNKIKLSLCLLKSGKLPIFTVVLLACKLVFVSLICLYPCWLKLMCSWHCWCCVHMSQLAMRWNFPYEVWGRGEPSRKEVSNKTALCNSLTASLVMGEKKPTRIPLFYTHLLLYNHCFTCDLFYPRYLHSFPSDLNLPGSSFILLSDIVCFISLYSFPAWSR